MSAVTIAVVLSAIATTAIATPPTNSSTPSEQDWTSKSPTDSGEDPGLGRCRLRAKDPFVHNKVHHLLTVERATLINYVLNFSNYSHNPLTINLAGVYNAKHWSRVTTAHGQTLLSLAFNYGVLSMMTLTLGTETLDIELLDSPPGCFALATDQHKVHTFGIRIYLSLFAQTSVREYVFYVFFRFRKKHDF